MNKTSIIKPKPTIHRASAHAWNALAARAYRIGQTTARTLNGGADYNRTWRQCPPELKAGFVALVRFVAAHTRNRPREVRHARSRGCSNNPQ